MKPQKFGMMGSTKTVMDSPITIKMAMAKIPVSMVEPIVMTQTNTSTHLHQMPT